VFPARSKAEHKRYAISPSRVVRRNIDADCPGRTKLW
jgi:hypothetical protein